MITVPESVRSLIESGRLAHLVTLNRDGTPQVTVIWVGLEGDEIVSGHLRLHQKLRNVRRNQTVAISLETTTVNAMGLHQYVVIYGKARVTEGGAPQLLQRLARVYLGPDVTFPPMPDPPPGYTLRITPERFTGVGPWAV
ncbi:MAG TPA: TIGR03618 family F420-dependent PPOX class oxidoreductase [Dehalococcoidia bacterium]|nr:TIGR03618 family F420-dependent PPOX class oxidoreductase [Dehalococcoidia bacterium]